jgi:hypothetical protein
MKYWEIIADNLSKAGFSWGCSSQIDSTGRVIFTADAYSRDGRGFTVLADERLTAFLELEPVTGVASEQAIEKLTALNQTTNPATAFDVIFRNFAPRLSEKNLRGRR